MYVLKISIHWFWHRNSISGYSSWYTENYDWWVLFMYQSNTISHIHEYSCINHIQWYTYSSYSCSVCRLKSVWVEVWCFRSDLLNAGHWEAELMSQCPFIGLVIVVCVYIYIYIIIVYMYIIMYIYIYICKYHPIYIIFNIITLYKDTLYTWLERVLSTVVDKPVPPVPSKLLSAIFQGRSEPEAGAMEIMFGMCLFVGKIYPLVN